MLGRAETRVRLDCNMLPSQEARYETQDKAGSPSGRNAIVASCTEPRFGLGDIQGPFQSYDSILWDTGAGVEQNNTFTRLCTFYTNLHICALFNP